MTIVRGKKEIHQIKEDVTCMAGYKPENCDNARIFGCNYCFSKRLKKA